MSELAIIAKFIARKDIRKTTFFEDEGIRNSAYNHVYRGLTKGKLQTDDDIARLLGYKSTDSSFRVFKTRFRTRLVQNLLFLDYRRVVGSRAKKALISCSLYITASKILFILAMRPAAVALLKLALSKAIRFELTEDVLFCTRYLMSHAALIPDAKLYNRCYEMHERYLIYQQAVMKADYYFFQAYLNYNNKRIIKREFAEKLFAYAEDLDKDRKALKLFNVSQRYYQMLGVAYQMLSDFQSSIKVQEECLRFMQANKQMSDEVRIGELYLNLALCYICTAELERAKSYLFKARKVWNSDSVSSLVTLSYIFLVYMLEGDYRQAGKVIKDAVSMRAYSVLHESQKELWTIFQAYYNLVSDKAQEGKKRKEKFVLNQFLEKVPAFSKDKEGTNIAILTIQIMHFLKVGDFETISSRIRPLKRYKQKYLSDDVSLRNRLFFDMIFIAEKENFVRERVKEKTAPYLEQLKEHKRDYLVYSIATEVIPYEQLWLIALECMPEEGTGV